MKLAWRCLILVQVLFLLVSIGRADTLYHLRTDSESMLARGALLLDSKTQTVDIATFQLKLDSAGYTFLAALVQGAKSGQKIRLAIDNGIMKNFPGVINYLKSLGIQIRFFNPINLKASDFISPIDSFKRYAHRLHIKAFIINGKTVIVGDKNYTLKSYHLNLPITRDQTTMQGKEFYIEGDGAQQVSQSFEEFWQHPSLQEASETAVMKESVRTTFEQTLSTHLDWLRQSLEKRGSYWKLNPFTYSNAKVLFDNNKGPTMAQVLELIKQTPDNSKVYIENPYFILYPELVTVLEDLRRRNVRVVLVLNSPEATDIKVVGAALNIDLPKLLEMGIEIELIDFKRRITHGKLILIGDSTVIAGSGNFDPLSRNNNLELNVQVDSPKLNQHLWRQFDNTRHTRSRAVMAGVSCSEVLNPRTYSPKPVSKPVRYIIELARPYL